MSQNLCNVDGRILPEASVTIPLLDRGFLFGDSIYEVVRTHRGRLFGIEQHFERLARSAACLDFELPVDARGFRARIEETLAAAHAAGPTPEQAAGRAGQPDGKPSESYVRIIVTRGLGSAPNLDPDFALGVPLMLVMLRALPAPDPRWLTEGLSAQLVSVRRNDRRALDPAVKSGNYLNNILGLIEAKKKGAELALFLGCDGQLTESETSNVWLVKDGEILTPNLESGILAGITRQMLLDLIEREGLPGGEASLREEDLRAADEIFLSSTIKDVAAVTKLDGQVVGEGRAGPVTLDLARRFAAHLDALVAD